MAKFFARARLPGVAGVLGALLIAGVAAGAAGQALILGQGNDSGTSQTTLTNAGLGAAFTLKTTNVSTNATGIFGWSSQTGTNVTNGVFGRADGPNAYGVNARHSGAAGNGAAILAEGHQNNGIIATSDETNAIEGTGDCTGLFCGANGVRGMGAGFGAGVYGYGEGSLAGVWGEAPASYDGWGVYGSAYTAEGIGVYGSSAGNAVVGDGLGAPSYTNCTEFTSYCAGGVFSGLNGVIGVSAQPNGVALFGIAQDPGTYALATEGQAIIQGNLTITGTCSGCTGSVTASNGGTQIIRQGDAVTLTGVTSSPDGAVVLVVQLAKKGDAVLGIADRAMVAAPDKVTLAATKTELKTRFGSKTTTIPARTLKSQVVGQLIDGGTSAAAGSFLRVITSGVYAYKATSALSVGDDLAVVSASGKLEKAAADSSAGSIAGKFLGTLKDGRIVVLVNPR